MSGNTENIRLGTCNVYIDGTAMGLTIGGVEVELTTEKQDSKVDQFGDTIVKSKIRGRTIMARFQLAESTVDNMVAVMPGSELKSTGGKRAIIKTGVGIDLLALAKPLLLRPIELDDATTPDKSEDFLIPLAATAGAFTFAYSNDTERVLNAEFNGFPTSEGVICEYGDPDAT